MSENEKYGVPPPNWGKVLPPPPAPQIKLGLPTRWGARTQGRLPTSGPANFTLINQIVRAETHDAYSRPWALIGSLTINAADWNRSPAPGAFDIDVYLDIISGVGQTSVEQRMSLRSLIFLATGSYTPTPTDVTTSPYRCQASGDRLSYPFFAAGIVGQSVSINATMFVFTPAAVVNPLVDVALGLTPYSAGTGL